MRKSSGIARSCFAGLFILLLFILVYPKPTYAFRHQALNEVLGVATSAALPQIDPTSEGPGLILPDSPFFFIDKWKQNIRLFAAFTPAEKAKINAQIAGERLAELRFMLARNNTKAAAVALLGVSDNLKQAADNLDKAQFEGKDVSKLSQDLNSNIKLKQKTLDSLEENSTGSLKILVEQAQEDVFNAKLKVVDSLPEDLVENEVENDLKRRIGKRADNASNSAELLNRDLESLSKRALETSQKSLSKRQEALQKAIGNKNEKEVEAEGKLFEAEKVRQQGLLTAQSKAAEQAKEALQKAREATSKFREAQQKVEEIRNQSTTPTSNVSNTGTNTSSGSSSSGSSSLNSSGSGSSGSGSTSSGSSSSGS